MDAELITLNLNSKIRQLETENETLKAEIKKLRQSDERPKKRKVKSLIAKLRKEKYSYKEIMDKTGFSYDYIRKACAEHGLTSPKIRNT